MLNSVTQKQRCLMISDKNGRQFFTHEDNLMPLLEFAKTFNMDLAIVNTTNAKILELTDLPKMICDTKAQSATEAEVIEQILPTDETKLIHIPFARTRSELLQTYKEVRKQIKNWMLNAQTIDMKYLKENLDEYELPDAAIRNQFNKVKQEFIDSGFTITSPKKGAYLAEPPKKANQKNIAEILNSPSFKQLVWGYETGPDMPTFVFE